MRFSVLIPWLAVMCSTAALAEEHRMFIDEAEPPTSSRIQDSEPWKEQGFSLPPWPKEGDLVEFELDNASSPFRYYIDGQHLAIGSDEVVRYTLVVESRSGTRNVSFEGIRCTPKGDHRLYAFGAKGSFQTAPEVDWQPIPTRGGDQIQRELHQHFLCIPLKFEPRPKKDMIRALSGHIHPRQNSGFMME